MCYILASAQSRVSLLRWFCLAWWVMRWDVIRRKHSTFLTSVNAIDTVNLQQKRSIAMSKLCKRYCYEIFTIIMKRHFLWTHWSRISIQKAVQKPCDVIIMLMTSNNGRRQSSLRSVRGSAETQSFLTEQWCLTNPSGRPDYWSRNYAITVAAFCYDIIDNCFLLTAR